MRGSTVGQGDSHKYTIQDMPKLHKRHCWQGESRPVNSSCKPLNQTGRDERTVFLSDGSWIVVVHHPGKKLPRRRVGKKVADRSADGTLASIFLFIYRNREFERALQRKQN
jgi:hypothetical protein